MISFFKYVFSALKIASFKSYDVRHLLIYFTEVFPTVVENIREGFLKFIWGSLGHYLRRALEGQRGATNKRGNILLILGQ